MTDSDGTGPKKRVANDPDPKTDSLQPFSIDVLFGWDIEHLRKQIGQKSPKSE
jgi:hypothetical protein